MKTKRLLAGFLSLLLLLPACSEAPESVEDQQTSDSGFTNPVSDAVETEPVETEILDALPDKTFSGRDFTILLRTGMEYEFFSEDLTGEIINDAVHERNTYPKYDDAQEKYYSTSTDHFSLILFPETVEDPEFVGCMTEAMCVVNSANVIPSYYDVALKDKYNRDAQSAEMLDIIRDSLIFDFGYLNSFALNTAGHLFVQLVRVGSTDFASSYAKNQKGYQKALDKMQEAYAD